jgi:putative transposase
MHCDGSGAESQPNVADYIVSFYNRSRRHGHLGGVSPEQSEAAHKPRRQGVH